MRDLVKPHLHDNFADASFSHVGLYQHVTLAIIRPLYYIELHGTYQRVYMVVELFLFSGTSTVETATTAATGSLASHTSATTAGKNQSLIVECHQD